MSEELKLANPVPTLKLDLACGQSPREGFEGVDLLAPNAQHKVDLTKFPWPWADNSVLELHCSHYVEHIPCREVEERDVLAPTGVIPGGERQIVSVAEQKLERLQRFVGQDMFLAFFDECYRILVPDGAMKVIVPCGRSNRAFQDPTHRRFLMQESFLYLNAEWRRLNKLDHYRARCNFGASANPTIPVEMTLLHPEAWNRRFNESWNVVIDWMVDLKVIK